MEFVVKQFEISVDILEQEAIQQAKYPVPDEVEIDDWESTLALVPIRQLSVRQKVKRFFRRRVNRFRIVLHQKRNLPREEAYGFVLGTGVSRRAAEEAFGQLHETLKPLLKDGEVLLTTVLLQTAILPRPKSTQQLSSDLVQVMEKQHESHPEWVSVVQALLIDGCATGDRQQVDTLVTKAGGDLERVNKKGKTPIQTARKLAPKSGLDWLMAPFKLESDQNDLGSHSQTSLQELSQKDQHESIWEVIGSKIKDVGTRILEEIGQAEEGDQEGNTPLMTAVMNGFTKSCIPLLIGGMDPNSSHPSTGDTALHCAVNCGNTTLVKLLCAFKADPCQANVKGETPLSRARASKSTKDCLEILESVVELRKTSTAYMESKRLDPIPTVKSGSPYLLSLDGGGVRSFVMCLILLEIEDRMKTLDPKCPPFWSFFDWIAGTSAGGVAALMLGHANASLQVASSFVMRSITDVFSKPKMSRRKLIETLLQDYLGDNIKMADRPSPKLVITTTLASHTPSKLHLMCNYGKPRDGQKGPEERFAWEAALATSAAPFHFPSFDGKFLDGGLVANNPTLDAMTEIFNSTDDETVELGFVLSVGTGFPPSKPVEDIEFFLPHPLKVFHLDTISGLSNLLDLFVEQVTQSNGPPVERARAWCKTIGTPYVRLSPPLSQDFSPATSDFSEIIDMLFDAYKYVLRNPEEIDKAAKLLLAKKSCGHFMDDVGTDC